MSWEFMMDFAWLSLFLGLSTFFKRKIPFLRKFIIPNAIIAGFIGLLFGQSVLKLVPFTEERLGTLVYHLLAIGFIALALKDRESKSGKYITNTAFFITSTYVFQGIIGFGIMYFLASFVYPDLFPGLGLLLPLGYGQGPGQAYSIGKTWESLGIFSAGSLGLAIATFGFLWACIAGVGLMNYRIKIKKEHADINKLDVKDEVIQEIDSAGDVPLSESIDRLSIQLFLIGITYLLTYLFLKGVSFLLEPLGGIGKTLSTTLWGFHFIFGTLFAMGIRGFFNLMKKKKIMIRNYPNNYLLQRISGGAFDFMIAASIAAISLQTVKYYLVPLLVMTTFGGVLTYWYCSWIAKKVYHKYHLEFTFMLFGNLTGTISTGLALLREIDPHFKSPAAESLVFGSGLALFIGFPLLLVLNLPPMGLDNPIYYLYTLGILILYFLVLITAWIFINKRRAKKEL